MNKRVIEYAYLETTNHCNLDCSYCNRKEVIGDLEHMSVETFSKVLDKLKDHPIKEAKLMGMGEPFLHPQFDVICKMFKEVFPDAYLIVATNCQYRIKDSFKESLKYIDLLYFSIDGYQDSYERDRSPAKWSKLITFLTEFQSVERYDCEVVCNYVVNPSNIDDIEILERHILGRFKIGQLRLNIAQDWSEDRTMVGGYTEAQLKYLKTHYGDKVMGKSVWDYRDCYWVQNGIYMTVDGGVKACCLNTSGKKYGNILEQTIDTIYNNLDYIEVKEGCENNTPTPHCANCSYKTLVPILTQIMN